MEQYHRQCCGRNIKTKFCPNCGGEVADSVDFGLLAYMRHQLEMEQESESRHSRNAALYKNYGRDGSFRSKLAINAKIKADLWALRIEWVLSLAPQLKTQQNQASE
jgi:hypothetical protein